MKIKLSKNFLFTSRLLFLSKRHISNVFMPIFIILFISSILFSSCKEESIGQYPVDNIPPHKISNPIVLNFKGGATIKYDLPPDKDILYIKAVYTLPNGKQKETIASPFVNELRIGGFAKSTKTSVKLITVDRSQNESDPVSVEIEPMDSPIFDIYESINVIASFGGIKINWENIENEEVLVGVLYNNEEGSYVPVENIYTSVDIGDFAVRGLENVETNFGIFVRDIYGNFTDTMSVILTPWKETELDKKLWRGMPICNSQVQVSPWGELSMSVLWNDIYITQGVFYLNKMASQNIFFTFDLGVSTKLSRFKFWGRNTFYFNLHHPKEFEIWGTNDPEVANGDPCSWDGWELLISGTSEKPSGPIALSHDNLTTEDLALAHAGEEFEFPLEVPFVRYIRYRTLRTWTNSNNSFLSELSFWGQVD